MRKFFVAAVFVLASAAATPGAAQSAVPWCLMANVGAGAIVELCYFRTFEACVQERFRYGGTSFCIVNPHYYFSAEANKRRLGKPRRRGNQ